jgi:hypothetical protein
MRHLSFILTLLVIIIPHPLIAELRFSPYLQTTPLSANIDSPVAGQVVQGSVNIHGNTNIDGFQSYEVDFSYVNDLTQTWFLIQENTTSIENGVLAVWDTSIITDGEYTLRLLINQIDGTQLESLVTSLRVRNYSTIETDTPTPIHPYLTLVPGLATVSPMPRNTPTMTLTPSPITPTPLPTNPAEITPSQMALTLGKGAGVSIALLAILGAYVGIRSYLRNRRYK